MSILLIEGFDVYPDVAVTSAGLQSRWTATNSTYPYANMVMTTGRFSGQAVEFVGSPTEAPGIAYALTAQGSGSLTLCLGVAFKLLASTSLMQVLGFYNLGPSGTEVVGIGINTSQQLFLFRGSTSTVLATATGAISTGSWHYLDTQISVNASTGSMTLYLDGVQVISYSGNTGSLAIDTLVLGPQASINVSTGLGAYDDLYVTSTSTRVGERRVETLYPDAAGASSAWTPLSGANYANVNATLNNNGATYVSTVAASASDLYQIGPLAGTPTTIDAVQTRISCAKSDAGSHTLKSQIKSGSTTTLGATYAVPGTFLYDCDIYTVDPNTSAAWTYTGVNACQIGQELIS
jgi:hypothetical protein